MIFHIFIVYFRILQILETLFEWKTEFLQFII